MSGLGLYQRAEILGGETEKSGVEPNVVMLAAVFLNGLVVAWTKVAAELRRRFLVLGAETVYEGSEDMHLPNGKIAGVNISVTQHRLQSHHYCHYVSVLTVGEMEMGHVLVPETSTTGIYTCKLCKKYFRNHNQRGFVAWRGVSAKQLVVGINHGNVVRRESHCQTVVLHIHLSGVVYGNHIARRHIGLVVNGHAVDSFQYHYALFGNLSAHQC